MDVHVGPEINVVHVDLDVHVHCIAFHHTLSEYIVLQQTAFTAGDNAVEHTPDDTVAQSATQVSIQFEGSSSIVIKDLSLTVCCIELTSRFILPTIQHATFLLLNPMVFDEFISYIHIFPYTV